MDYSIYTDDYYGNIEIDYGRGYFRVNPESSSPKMKAWLREVIKSNQWDIDWYLTSSGEHYYGWDEICKTTFTSTNRSWDTLEARHQLSWFLLGELYIGTPFEQGIDAWRRFKKSVLNIRAVFIDTRYILGDLFKKPEWLMSKKERNDRIPF